MSQPRVPAGSSRGGQFALSGAGGSGGKDTVEKVIGETIPNLDNAKPRHRKAAAQALADKFTIDELFDLQDQFRGSNTDKSVKGVFRHSEKTAAIANAIKLHQKQLDKDIGNYTQQIKDLQNQLGGMK
jgi:hypothetical protein